MGLTGGRMNVLAISQRVIAVIASDSSCRTGVMTVTGFLAWPWRMKVSRECGQSAVKSVAWWRRIITTGRPHWFERRQL